MDYSENHKLETDKKLEAYKQRANHEDNLHNSRTGLFLTFNH